MCAGFRVCVRTRTLVPQGRLSVAQDDSPGFVQLIPEGPVGTTERYPGTTAPVVFSHPYGTESGFLRRLFSSS